MASPAELAGSVVEPQIAHVAQSGVGLLVAICRRRGNIHYIDELTENVEGVDGDRRTAGGGALRAPPLNSHGVDALGQEPRAIHSPLVDSGRAVEVHNHRRAAIEGHPGPAVLRGLLGDPSQVRPVEAHRDLGRRIRVDVVAKRGQPRVHPAPSARVGQVWVSLLIAHGPGRLHQRTDEIEGVDRDIGPSGRSVLGAGPFYCHRMFGRAQQPGVPDVLL